MTENDKKAGAQRVKRKPSKRADVNTSESRNALKAERSEVRALRSLNTSALPNDDDDGTSGPPTGECVSCGSHEIETEWFPQHFEYGIDEERVTLAATVPVRRCERCGFEFLDGAAEDARHEAVCTYLGRLPPRI